MTYVLERLVQALSPSLHARGVIQRRLVLFLHVYTYYGISTQFNGPEAKPRAGRRTAEWLTAVGPI